MLKLRRGIFLILTMLPPTTCGGETLAESIRRAISREEALEAKNAGDKARREYLQSFETWPDKRQRSECLPPEILSPCLLDPRVQFLPPLPAATPANLTALSREFPLGEFGYWETSWAPVDEVQGGSIEIARLLRFASSRELIVRDRDEWRIVIESTTADSEGRTLAICSAGVSKGVPGPPDNCYPIAFHDGTTWWMEVIERDGYPMLSIVRLHTLHVEGLPRDSVLKVLDRALAATPLKLPNRTVKRNRIHAIAPRRFSQILSGNWFEWAEVFVHLDAEYEVEVSLNLLVNKQNTADPSHWHMPIAQQIDEYRRAVVQTVDRALVSICINPRWSGSASLRCGQLRTADGGKVSIPKSASHEGSKIPLNKRIKRSKLAP